MSGKAPDKEVIDDEGGTFIAVHEGRGRTMIGIGELGDVQLVDTRDLAGVLGIKLARFPHRANDGRDGKILATGPVVREMPEDPHPLGGEVHFLVGFAQRRFNRILAGFDGSTGKRDLARVGS